MSTADIANKQFHTITQVESPEVLILDSAIRIRLLGVRANAPRMHEAIEFLRKSCGSQRVFMNQDKVKFDRDGLPLAYVYLENGLFVNALLVKHDLVDVDEDTPFKYRERFLKRQFDNRAQSG